MKIRVGILFGGASVEHEISVISALQAMDHMDLEKYEVVPIYISKDREFYTGDYLKQIEHYQSLEEIMKNTKKVHFEKRNQEFCLVSTHSLFSKVVDKIDVALPIVHGQNVEDGTLAGFLETLGIPYASSNLLASSLAQDKVVMKQIFHDNQIPIVPYVWFYDTEYLKEKKAILQEIAKMGYPVVVKPACLGSSIGISFAKDEKEAQKAIENAISYDRKIVVEKSVEHFIEVNCSILGNYEHQEVGVLEEVLSSKDILTFDDKYVGKGKTKGASKGMVNASRIIPASISDELKNKVEELSLKVFRVLNLSGVCRIDYLINENTKEVFVNEPNAIPGSLAFYLWEAKGKKYSELLDDIIRIGIKEYKEKREKITKFDTNVLKDFKRNGVKK